MKKLKLLLIFVAFLMFFSSCKKDDDDNNNTAKTSLESIIQNGNWKITKYIDSGVSEINHFEGYVFTFKSSGALLATKNSDVITGSWSISEESSDDDSNDDLDFNILFSSPEKFQDISDDWDIISKSNNKVELIDISGGNGETDYLTFEKN